MAGVICNERLLQNWIYGSNFLRPKKRNLPGEVKAKVDVVSWGDRARVYREGRNARGMELDLLAVNSEANLEAAKKAINDAAEDTAFYPHTSARFARVAVASAWPEEIIQKINAFWRGKAKIYYNSPYTLRSGHDLDAEPKRAFGGHNTGRFGRSSSRRSQHHRHL
jgi:hypothetical protein